MEIKTILPIVQIVLAVLITVSVILQKSEAGAGGVFGGSDSVSSWRTRRGFEKFLFVFTIILAVLFLVTAVMALNF
jgi:preprotein translocase subunit SecG